MILISLVITIIVKILHCDGIRIDYRSWIFVSRRGSTSRRCVRSDKAGGRRRRCCIFTLDGGHRVGFISGLVFSALAQSLSGCLSLCRDIARPGKVYRVRRCCHLDSDNTTHSVLNAAWTDRLMRSISLKVSSEPWSTAKGTASAIPCNST